MSEVDDIYAELKDKFGRPPAVAENFLSFSRLKLRFAHSGYTRLRVKDEKVYIESGHSIWKLKGKIPELKRNTPEDKFKELMGLVKSIAISLNNLK